MRTTYLELKSHSFKPAPKFYYDKEDKARKEKLFLGAEVETECLDENMDTYDLTQKIIRVADDDNNWIYAKTDGSLRHGIEFVTHPATLTRHYTLPWEKFLKACAKYNCTGNMPRCGLHIHASRGAMSQADEMKLGYFVYTHKAKMQKIAGRSSSYAKFHTNIDDNPEIVKSIHDRYVALNWQNTKTVEFRLFKGTTDYPVIMACLECVHSLVYFVKRVSMEDLKDRRKAWKKYLEYVASKDYKFLKEHFNTVFAKPKTEGDEEDE